jgi:hypothetical protein
MMMAHFTQPSFANIRLYSQFVSLYEQRCLEAQSKVPQMMDQESITEDNPEEDPDVKDQVCLEIMAELSWFIKQLLNEPTEGQKEQKI